MECQEHRQVTIIKKITEAGGISNDAGDTVIITRLETDPAFDSEPPVIGSADAAPTPLLQGTPKSEPAAPATASRVSGDSPALDATGRTPAEISSSAPPAKSADVPDPVPPPIANTITVNLARILENGDTSSNVVLQPGDVVTVPHAGIVYALGAVTRPGG